MGTNLMRMNGALSAYWKVVYNQIPSTKPSFARSTLKKNFSFSLTPTKAKGQSPMLALVTSVSCAISALDAAVCHELGVPKS